MIIRLLLLAVSASVAADPRTSVPAFAHIAEVCIGLNTMETLEKRIGPGLPSRGGHPRGLRTWRVKGAVLQADGFNSFDRRGISYAGGRQVDSFWLGASDDTAASLPRAFVAADELKFMGRIRLGTEKSAVLKALSKVLPPPEEKDDALVWRAKGFVRVSHVNHYTSTEWTARLQFKNGRLHEIAIDCQ